jgi:hypothetical protein
MLKEIMRTKLFNLLNLTLQRDSFFPSLQLITTSPDEYILRSLKIVIFLPVIKKI